MSQRPYREREHGVMEHEHGQLHSRAATTSIHRYLGTCGVVALLAQSMPPQAHSPWCSRVHHGTRPPNQSQVPWHPGLSHGPLGIQHSGYPRHVGQRRQRAGGLFVRTRQLDVWRVEVRERDPPTGA